MKISPNILSTFLAIGATSSTFGQLTAFDLDRTSEWGQLSEAFRNDISALFTDSPHGIYSSFTFGWDGSNPATGEIILDPVGPNPTGMERELVFTILSVNPPTISSEQPIPISYLGNRSKDDNYFGFLDLEDFGSSLPGDPSNTLYNYRGTNNSEAPDDPNTIYSQPSNPDLLTKPGIGHQIPDLVYSGTPVEVAFWHRNGVGDFPSDEFDFMSYAARFYIFKARDPELIYKYDEGFMGVFFGYEYYFMALVDLETPTFDFDDGFFLARVTHITPTMPEPSAIGLLGFAAVIELLGLRRRR